MNRIDTGDWSLNSSCEMNRDRIIANAVNEIIDFLETHTVKEEENHDEGCLTDDIEDGYHSVKCPKPCHKPNEKEEVKEGQTNQRNNVLGEDKSDCLHLSLVGYVEGDVIHVEKAVVSDVCSAMLTKKCKFC